MPRTFLLALGATACTPSPCPKGSEERGDGLCYLTDSAPEDGTTPAGDTGPTDDTAGTGDTAPPSSDYALGDPVTVLGTSDAGGGLGMPILYEWTDAAAINDEWAITTGQGGYGIISMATGELVHQENIRRALRVATDGQNAILATRTDGLMRVDVSAGPDTRGTRDFRAPELTTPHEDVDVSGSLVAVGWRDEGLLILDIEGTLLSTVPAEDAFAVSIEGERLAFTDGGELVLLDIADPSSPVELHRQSMSSEGRDMAWQGAHLVVGMGGAGTSIWRVQDDQLIHRTDIRTPGSALSVAVDGDRAWIGAWEVTALVDLAATPPVVLGHEPPKDSAMGVAASGGRAVVADWFYSTALQATDGVAGPELVVEDALFFDPTQSSTRRLHFENHGALDMDVRIDRTGDGYTVSDTAFAVAPGERAVVTVSWPEESRPSTSELSWSSNDPDEPTGTITLQPADQGIGTEHEDFTLPGFQLPDDTERNWTLSDTRGKVHVLVYWALY